MASIFSSDFFDREKVLSLTRHQKVKALVVELDFQARRIIQEDGEEGLLLFLARKMREIKSIMSMATDDELNEYCETFRGFHQAMKLLEQLSNGIAEGMFDDVI